MVSQEEWKKGLERRKAQEGRRGADSLCVWVYVFCLRNASSIVFSEGFSVGVKVHVSLGLCLRDKHDERKRMRGKKDGKGCSLNPFFLFYNTNSDGIITIILHPPSFASCPYVVALSFPLSPSANCKQLFVQSFYRITSHSTTLFSASSVPWPPSLIFCQFCWCTNCLLECRTHLFYSFSGSKGKKRSSIARWRWCSMADSSEKVVRFPRQMNLTSLLWILQGMERRGMIIIRFFFSCSWAPHYVKQRFQTFFIRHLLILYELLLGFETLETIIWRSIMLIIVISDVIIQTVFFTFFSCRSEAAESLISDCESE